MNVLLSQLQLVWHLLRLHYGGLMLAVIFPFICSHLVVLFAREIGMPYRLGLDFAHGVFVLGYLTTVVRLEFLGLGQFGFSWPRLKWPGLEVLATALVSVILIGLPIALILHPLTQSLEQNDGVWAIIPTVMVPEFIMTTLLGLALAAALGKVKS